MTLVNHETGEIVVSYGEVRASVEKARASGTTFFEQIVWQIENRAWEVLGYSDWDEMRDAEYGDMGVVVPKADRPEIVSRLRRTGMTQADIAETVGVTPMTVSRDLAELTNVRSEEPPVTITNSRGQQRPASYAPKPVDHAALADAAIAEFPELAYYRDEVRDLEHCWRLADTLRGFGAAEQQVRLETLRRSIEVDRSKRNGTYVPPTYAIKSCPTCGQEVKG